ncbi:MAG: peptide chain release factor N(5)-glutamine methyltransferase [bacterium]|nr:peptide chain release factor N(5)-glutamine methyltransferase [bacterium]
MSEWTIGTALKEAKKQLAITSDTASLDAQLLLAHVLGVERSHVIAYSEELLTDDQFNAYVSLIQRRDRGEPYAYLVGERDFYGRKFIITPDVLIPRPDTEHLVEHAILMVEGFYKYPSQVKAIDIGTGSGAIAISFALRFPEATVYASDISPKALAVAKRNAALHGATNIQFLEGSLLEPIRDNNLKVDLILANLPYIPTGDLPRLSVSKFEPRLALDGGDDGLEYFDQLFMQVREVGIPPIRLFLEVGSGQSQDVINLASQYLEVILKEVIHDYAGHDRVVRLSVK